jgi:hypothetical protein
VKLLYPNADEVYEIAVREADPRFVAAYEPITPGPIVALLLLACVGLASAIYAPLRIGRSLVRRKNSPA